MQRSHQSVIRPVNPIRIRELKLNYLWFKLEHFMDALYDRQSIIDAAENGQGTSWKYS